MVKKCEMEAEQGDHSDPPCFEGWKYDRLRLGPVMVNGMFGKLPMWA